MLENKVAVAGGCGHVGLPLALALSTRGFDVVSYDVNQETVRTVNTGSLPFMEPHAEVVLKESLAKNQFIATTDPRLLIKADVVIVVIGTPVDEHLNPDANAVVQSVAELIPFLKSSQLLILRSTVFPGVSRQVKQLLDNSLCAGIDVAFCPERIAEGKAFEELQSLPQIISGFSDSAVKRSQDLFLTLTNNTIVTSPEEAELAKLFTNTWRYIKFAAANQFFMIANDFGIDFARIRDAITFEYPRAADLPGPGFAAGPCLFKDTMQLAAYNNNNFTLGHASMMINEGLPFYITSRLQQKYELKEMTIGILGMAFKAESDDIRSSLSYKIRKILQFHAKEVLCTDEYVVSDSRLVDLEVVMEQSDLLLIGAPHLRYQSIVTSKPVVDIWNLRGVGTLI